MIEIGSLKIWLTFLMTLKKEPAKQLVFEMKAQAKREQQVNLPGFIEFDSFTINLTGLSFLK